MTDQTGAFWPGEPHRADVILEARADLRSDQPVACGGLSALQGPQPPALAVVANSPARCSSLISLTNHEPVPLERCPQHMRGSPTRCKMGAQRQCAACCQRVTAMAMANGPAGRNGWIESTRSHGRAAWPLVQSTVAVSDDRRARIHWCARCSHARFRRCAGGRPARGGNYWELR